MQYTYLLINLGTILVPFIFSFHPRIRFDRMWKYFLPVVFPVAALFVVWDMLFTEAGIWSFNPRYVTGIDFYNLPLEEVLFFICIPYACVFTYYCLDKFYNLQWKPGREKTFLVLFCFLLIALGIIFRDRWYPFVTFTSTALICLLLYFLAGANWIGKAFSVYAILLIPFFIVNGILTGTGLEEPVVLYNDAENLGLRIGTIPVEDSIYGFELFLLNIAGFEWLRKQKKSIVNKKGNQA